MINKQTHEWFFAHKSDFGNSVDVYLRPYLWECRDQPIRVSKITFETEEYKDGDWIPPTMSLHVSEAQQMLDSLWESGLRPSCLGEPTAGAPPHVDALKDHIATLKESHQVLLLLAGKARR